MAPHEQAAFPRASHGHMMSARLPLHPQGHPSYPH
jgi:hypothetical protein